MIVHIAAIAKESVKKTPLFLHKYTSTRFRFRYQNPIRTNISSNLIVILLSNIMFPYIIGEFLRKKKDENWKNKKTKSGDSFTHSLILLISLNACIFLLSNIYIYIYHISIIYSFCYFKFLGAKQNICHNVWHIFKI